MRKYYTFFYFEDVSLPLHEREGKIKINYFEIGGREKRHNLFSFAGIKHKLLHDYFILLVFI